MHLPPRPPAPSQSALRLVALLALVCLPQLAQANGRHFAFSYESATLPAGAAEIEPWTTARIGKDSYYMRLDQRLEFEFGLTDRLQSAIYLNFSGIASGSGTNRTEVFAHKGVSSEWKYKLTDAVADAVGSALYLEGTLEPQEVELEGKLLLDKRIGAWHGVFNAIYEKEWKLKPNGTRHEHKLAASAGLAYFLDDRFSLGLEAVQTNVFEAEGGTGELELEHGALFFGPSAAYHAKSYWIVAAVTPQILGTAGAPSGRLRNLDEFEAVHARILLGFHL